MQLVSVQREAERVARQLGIDTPVQVVWGRDCPDRGRWGRRTYAHCHISGKTRGTICLTEPFGIGPQGLERGGVACAYHNLCQLRPGNEPWRISVPVR